MRSINRRTVKNLYRDAILQVFGSGDKEADKSLIEAVASDIHFGDEAPGEWSPDSVLEIYCENGIPNATDIFYPQDYGFEGSASYNSESWADIDGVVNLMLEAMQRPERFHHEPYNGAVINIYRS